MQSIGQQSGFSDRAFQVDIFGPAVGEVEGMVNEPIVENR